MHGGHCRDGREVEEGGGRVATAHAKGRGVHRGAVRDRSGGAVLIVRLHHRNLRDRPKQHQPPSTKQLCEGVDTASLLAGGRLPSLRQSWQSPKTDNHRAQTQRLSGGMDAEACPGGICRRNFTPSPRAAFEREPSMEKAFAVDLARFLEPSPPNQISYLASRAHLEGGAQPSNQMLGPG